MNQQDKDNLKKMFADKREQKKALQEELGRAQAEELQLRQRQINIAQEIRTVQGGIETLEELLGEKKPEPKKEKK